MNWDTYFVYDEVNEHYYYKNKNEVTLPDNLPMPPTDDFRKLFAECTQLQDITALSNWDISNVKYMENMFYGCHKLQDITALSDWNINKIIDIRDMFYECHADIDLAPLLGN